MKLRLTMLTVFILSLAATAFGQAAKIEGYVSNDKGIRLAGVRIVVTPGGQSGTTDSKGNFTISLPGNVQPGQAAQIRVDRVGWVIFNPMFGKCETKSAGRNFEPLAVVIVPKGSPLAFSPNRLSKVITKWADERARLRTQAGKLKQELDEYDFLREYAAEYGFTLDQFRAAAEQWARIKDSDDKEERALKEYWLKNYRLAAQLAGESAQAADDELEQANKKTLEASLKVIRRYKLKGNAFYADYRFSEALAAYGEIEQRFESRKISKEEFTQEWAAVKLSLGNTKGELGKRGEGVEGPRLLLEASAAYRQAQTFYTREQSPRQWATAQGNLGNVLRELGVRVDGESLKYLNEAEAAHRNALDVFTRAQLPQHRIWAQNNLGIVLRDLGIQGEGTETLKYLKEAVATFREALEAFAREQLPRRWDWATAQHNLGIVLADLGTRVEGVESLRYLRKAEEAYRATLDVFTRPELPQQWAMAQHSLGTVLRSLGVRVDGAESLRYLKEAEAAHRAALEVRTRAELPQDWAKSQNHLGVVLGEVGTRIEGVESLQYLKGAEAAHRAALNVFSHGEFPQDWATTQNDLGNALRRLGERAQREEGVRYLKEAEAAHRGALEVRTRERLPQDWAATQNNLSLVLNELAARTEGVESVKYLREAEAACRAALEVFTRAQLPQQWAATQTSLGNVLAAIGLRGEKGESVKYLKEAREAYRASLEARTREQSPQDWATTQNNLGIVLGELSVGVTGEGSIKYLKEAESAYRAALEVRTREQLPQDWAATQNNLAITYFLHEDWAGASQAYANVLQVYPDEANAYRRAIALYHDVLFNFDQAFALHQQWLSRHKGDLAAEVQFSEAHFTTGRFAECRQQIAALLARPEPSASTKTALRAIEIASLLAINETSLLPNKLDALIAEVSRQPEDFKVKWNFAGTQYFIGHNDKLSPYNAWLGQLFDAFEGEERNSIRKALEEVRAKFKK